MGIGIVPRELAREGVHTDGSKSIPPLFPSPKNSSTFNPAAVNITIGDGRFYINKSQKHYDAIILDAFLGDSSPSHLMTREAFSEMARLLGQTAFSSSTASENSARAATTSCHRWTKHSTPCSKM